MGCCQSAGHVQKMQSMALQYFPTSTTVNPILPHALWQRQVWSSLLALVGESIWRPQNPRRSGQHSHARGTSVGANLGEHRAEQCGQEVHVLVVFRPWLCIRCAAYQTSWFHLDEQLPRTIGKSSHFPWDPTGHVSLGHLQKFLG